MLALVELFFLSLQLLCALTQKLGNSTNKSRIFIHFKRLLGLLKRGLEKGKIYNEAPSALGWLKELQQTMLKNCLTSTD
jgi:hypothetical protein